MKTDLRTVEVARRSPKKRLRTIILILFATVLVCGNEPRATQKRSSHPEQAPPVAGVEFRLIKAISGKTEDGATFSVNVYRSSDNFAVSSRLDTFTSAASARKELENIVSTINVLERGSKLSKAGGRRGERIVASYKGEAAEVYNAVLWTNKKELHRIEGTSLQRVLDFEKQFYP